MITKKQKIGLYFILAGVAMFVLGVSIFTYRGNNLNPLISKAGMCSFFLWLPTIVVGIVFMVIGRRR